MGSIPNLMGSFFETIKMNLFMNLKTNNPIFDMLITTLIIGLISAITNMIAKNKINYECITSVIIEYVWPINSIVIEGKQSIKSSTFNTRSEQMFSNRFRALWQYISLNIDKNPSIYGLKEYAESFNTYDQFGTYISASERVEGRDIYVVKQKRYFRLKDGLFCKVHFSNESIDNGSKTLGNIETISLKLYSYKLSLSQLKIFIDEITNKFLENIDIYRCNKQFIYTLVGDDNDDRDKFSSWEECVFESSRTFDNLFFDKKEELIEKLIFFRDNKDWYDREGHPYTFGLALYGPPGTGKTSVIKCIANLLKRHLIVIPLNKIKTQRELSRYYFEHQYNKNNKSNSINFNNKIIVLDDLDCMGDLVHCRTNAPIQGVDINQDVSARDILEVMTKTVQVAGNDSGNRDIFKVLDKNDDKLTLSFILNTIDGIRETPGRILIITSNYYHKIDEALRRPGRIDYPLEMGNATINTICDIYKHYYKTDFPAEQLKHLKSGILSPAKIVNLRLQATSAEHFIELLRTYLCKI